MNACFPRSAVEPSQLYYTCSYLMGSERKQKEVAEILSRLNIDIVAGQESWEREGKNIVVDGSKWFGKPRKDQSNPRGEGGVGFW